jgi:hypothetical protein
MWKFGTEAAQFLLWEYINGICVAVCALLMFSFLPDLDDRIRQGSAAAGSHSQASSSGWDLKIETMKT